MLGHHFYYQLTRKYITIFGNMFNNITLVRTNKDTGVELDRIKVPIVYGPKEKYVTRINQDPDLAKETAITLPRMSFELTGMNYDAGRKQNTLLRTAKGNNATRVSSQYMGVPYNLQFVLNIYTRYIDDADHIKEQILPSFTPDYTVTIDSVPEIGFLKDIPIILDTFSQDIQYEGNYDAVRYVIYTMTFTLKGYFYGPISTPKIIRTVFANIYNDPSLKAGYVTRMNLDTGNNGVFKLDDIAYQGNNMETANAYGIVVNWNPGNGKLALGGVQGQFKINNTIRAASSNAAYTIDSFDISPLKLAEIKIEPDPLDALPTEDFGYTTTITEWPQTE